MDSSGSDSPHSTHWLYNTPMRATFSTWLIALTPTRATFPNDVTAAELLAVAAHLEHLQGLQAQGVVVLAGRTADEAERTPIGLVLVYAKNEAEAQSVIDGDPAVRSGVMNAELRPFRVALGPPGLVSLDFTP